MWTPLAEAAEIDAFVASFHRFHDGTLRGMHVVTGGQTGPTSVVVVLSDLQGPAPAVEILCDRVMSMRLRPSKPDCDSIIATGRITASEGVFALAVNFIGGPLRGPPGGSIVIPSRDLEDPDVYVGARSMAWRRAERV